MLAALADAGISVRDAATRDLDDARRLAAEAATRARRCSRSAGDGLIGAVADALRARPDAVIGILPGGRGNDFARVLGIPRRPGGGLRVIATGAAARARSRRGDGRAFVSIASAGFDSEANRIANEAPAALGGLVYAYGLLRALAGWKPGADGDRARPAERSARVLVYTVAAANSASTAAGCASRPTRR